MAHFAEVKKENNIWIVQRVLVVPDDQEHRGQEYLSVDVALGGIWIKTSYNTFQNTHTNGGTPLRGNYAGIGMIYNPQKDLFYGPKPYPSWIWSDEKANFMPPVSMPTDGLGYVWNEEIEDWTIWSEQGIILF